MLKLTHAQIVARQEVLVQSPRLPFSVVLNDIRSLHNVGSIFRTADGAGVEKLYLCGITGAPPQSEIEKTALGAQERIPWEYHRDAVPVVEGLKKSGYRIVLLEQTDESQDYAGYVPDGPLALILGNETAGVAEPLVALADAALEIPMAGIKNSLNVSVAFGIVIYHLRQAWARAQV